MLLVPMQKDPVALSAAVELCEGNVVLVEDAHDIHEYIDSLLHNAPEKLPLREMVKYMSWRIGGLPLKYLEAICQNYSDIESLLAAATGEEIVVDSTLLEQALGEIRSFLSQDYYIE